MERSGFFVGEGGARADARQQGGAAGSDYASSSTRSTSLGLESHELGDPPGLEKQDGERFVDGEDARTTVMLRNLPNNYNRDMLRCMLDDGGFGGLYDFLYMPMDLTSRACLGYAFINLVGVHVAARFWQMFDGYSSWKVPSRKVCQVSWSDPHQGLHAHVELYRNSTIMHASVPDECKPMLFKDGQRIEFPLPTRSTKPPRLVNRRPRGVRRRHLQPSTSSRRCP